MKFSLSDLPNLNGKVAIITGATGGLGLETALALTGAGAHVLVTGRNAAKGAEALSLIKTRHPRGDARFVPLDLASLAGVQGFAEKTLADLTAIDILVNNAGVMAPPRRQTTSDGFELQFGTNYLGHFALTAQLLPALTRAKARVVSLASVAARGAAIHFNDLQATRRYIPFVSYGQSKLAMLMFAYELQRRSDAAGWGLTSIAAHPGVSRTNLIANGPAQGGAINAAVGRFLSDVALRVFGHSAEEGALPQIFAAAGRGAEPGAYYGPTQLLEFKGPVGAAKPPRAALDVATGGRLWDVSMQLTGLPFGLGLNAA